MNEHVVEFYRFRTWLAKKHGLPLAQIVWYTAMMKEIDQNWSPYA